VVEVVVEEEDIPDLAATAREIDIAAEETGATLRKAEEIEAIQEIEEIEATRETGEIEAIHQETETEVQEEEEDLDPDLIAQDTSNHQNHMIAEIAITEIKERAERILTTEKRRKTILNLSRKRKIK